MNRLLMIAALLIACGTVHAESGTYPPAGATPPTPGGTSSDCHNPEYISCKGPCDEDYCVTAVAKPPNGKCPDGSDPVPNASGMDLWRRNHHHIAYDYASVPIDDPMSGGCAPCGGAAERERIGELDHLIIQRRHRYRDFWIWSSFGPGVFCNYDIKLELSPRQWDWQPMVNVFDPQQNGFAMYMMEYDFDLGESAIDGVYHDPASRRIKRLELRDATGLQPDQHLATHAIITTITGETLTFEIVRTQADAADPLRSGRFVRYQDRNGNATVITYAYPASATDAQLGGDRTRLWQMADVTDMYGLTATFRYRATPVHGRWCVDRIGLPDGRNVDYHYGTSTPGWGWIGGALRRVAHPDGSSSTFDLAANPDRMGGMILRYDDNVAGSGHGRKDVYLTSTTWTNPDTGIVSNTVPNLCTKIVNGGELAYLVWDEPTDAQIFYAYLGGGKLMRVRNDGARNPVEVSYARRFDLTQPGTTYDWEVFVQQENDRKQRTTRRIDHLGRSSSYRYEPSMRGLKGVTHPDGSVESWEYDAFHRETRHVDRLGRITEQAYDAAGNRLRRTVAVGTVAQATTSWTYNGRGQPLSMTDANGNITSYGYDARGFLASVTDPPDVAGGPRATRTWSHDAAGRLVASADASGRVTTYEFDARNRHVRSRYADGSFEEVVFGSGSLAALPASTRDRNGVLTTHGYDSALRRVRTTVADGTAAAVTETCTYVPGTQIEATCLKAGDLVERVHDHRMRPIAITIHPRADRALTMTRRLDAANRLLAEVDPFGRTTRFVYDSDDRLVRQVRELVPGGLPAGADPATVARNLAPNAPFVVLDTAYDAEGQIVATIDGRGIATTHAHDGQGRTVVTVIAAGTAVAARSETGYDPMGNVVEIRHPRHFVEAGGFRTTATWTGRHLLASRTEATGRPEAGTTAWTYTPTRQRATETDERGMTTRWTYGACCDRVVGVQDPSGALTTFTYDPVGNVLSVTDGNGDVTRRAYDARRRVVADTDGAGATITFAHDDDLDDAIGIDATYSAQLAGLGLGTGADGSATTLIDPLGHPLTEIRDGVGRTVAVIDAHGAARLTRHDQVVAGTPGAPGALVATTEVDPLGHTTSRRRDAAGRDLALIDGLGRVRTSGFDANGNRVSSRDPLGVGDDRAFDARDRVVAESDTSGDTVATAYDAHGNVVSSTDGLGQATVTTWDARDQRRTVTDPAGATTSFAYDPAGLMIAVMDAEGSLTTYAYDVRGLLVGETLPPPTGGGRSYAYDAAQRLISRIDQDGVVTSYRHDHAGRMVARRYPDGRDDTFAYDAAGRLVEAASARYGNRVLRAYDAADRLIRESLIVPGNAVIGSTVRHDVHYGHDADGRVVLIGYPDGRVSRRTYTADDALDRVTFDGTTIASRLYDGAGRLRTTTFGNGLVETRTWRSDARLASIRTPGVAGFDYAYDGAKRVTAQADSERPALSQTFAFDAQDRLVGWTRADGRDQAWTLTPVGDWATTTRDGIAQVRTHTAAHEIASIDGVALAHDSRGNRTRDREGRGFAWDHENRLALATTSSGPVAYAYDALGRRVSRSAGGLTTTFVCAGAEEILEIDSDDLVVDAAALDGAPAASAARPLGGVLEGAGVIRVDFQPPGVATAAGYVADTGAGYGPRPGGLVFGWRDGAHPHAVDADRVALQQWDTTHAMQPAGGPVGSWEIALPDGHYPVVVVMGDAAHRDMANDVEIEKKHGDDPDPYDPLATPGYEQGDFDGYAIRAQVKDGRLTIAPRASSANAKICFVEIGVAGGHVDGAVKTRLEGLVRRMTSATAGTPAKRRIAAHVLGSGIDDHLATVDSKVWYLHADRVGSIAAVSDGAGAVVERTAYDAYGARTSWTGSGSPLIGGSALRIGAGFTGRWHDEAMGLTWFRSRWYSPADGRFVSRDPVAAGYRVAADGLTRRGTPWALDGYVDGLSLYAAYFVPGGRDPYGLQDEIPWEDFWKKWKEDHPGLTKEQYKWAEKQLARGCVGVTAVSLGESESNSDCYDTQANADAAAAKKTKDKKCPCYVYSVHLWNDKGSDGSKPDVSIDPKTGKADLKNWDGKGRPPGPWKPRGGGGVNFDYGFVRPDGKLTHADQYHNPDRDSSGKGDYYPRKKIRSATIYVSTPDEWKKSYPDFNAEVWCVQCPTGKYGK